MPWDNNAPQSSTPLEIPEHEKYCYNCLHANISATDCVNEIGCNGEDKWQPGPNFPERTVTPPTPQWLKDCFQTGLQGKGITYSYGNFRNLEPRDMPLTEGEPIPDPVNAFHRFVQAQAEVPRPNPLDPLEQVFEGDDTND